jgi:hypothetical protein
MRYAVCGMRYAVSGYNARGRVEGTDHFDAGATRDIADKPSRTQTAALGFDILVEADLKHCAVYHTQLGTVGTYAPMFVVDGVWTRGRFARQHGLGRSRGGTREESQWSPWATSCHCDPNKAPVPKWSIFYGIAQMLARREPAPKLDPTNTSACVLRRPASLDSFSQIRSPSPRPATSCIVPAGKQQTAPLLLVYQEYFQAPDLFSFTWPATHSLTGSIENKG